MRISDWSSDVCSSDLSTDAQPHFGRVSRYVLLEIQERRQTMQVTSTTDFARVALYGSAKVQAQITRSKYAPEHFLLNVINHEYGLNPALVSIALGNRSEEHTSELQSLMRISYAV